MYYAMTIISPKKQHICTFIKSIFFGKQGVIGEKGDKSTLLLCVLSAIK